MQNTSLSICNIAYLCSYYQYNTHIMHMYHQWILENLPKSSFWWYDKSNPKHISYLKKTDKICKIRKLAGESYSLLAPYPPRSHNHCRKMRINLQTCLNLYTHILKISCYMWPITSISRFKYLSISLRMLFRECKGKSGGVVVLRWAFFLCAIGKAGQRNGRLFKSGYTSTTANFG